MVSKNKLSKVGKKHHWGGDGKFLKIKYKCKGVSIYNSSLRKTLKEELRYERTRVY